MSYFLGANQGLENLTCVTCGWLFKQKVSFSNVHDVIGDASGLKGTLYKYGLVSLNVKVTLFSRKPHWEPLKRPVAQTSMKHLPCTDIDTEAAAEVMWWMGCLMWPGVHPGDSGGLRFRPVHEGFDPRCTVYEFCGGYNVLHPAVFHLREETQSGYFCVRHSTEEEHQRCSIFPLLAWRKAKGKITCKS